MATKTYMPNIKITNINAKTYEVWAKFKAAEINALWDKRGYSPKQRKFAIEEMEKRLNIEKD